MNGINIYGGSCDKLVNKRQFRLIIDFYRNYGQITTFAFCFPIIICRFRNISFLLNNNWLYGIISLHLSI